MTQSVVSIGYERRSVADLVQILAAQGVVKLIDVRELPISRRPGFSKVPLATSLEAAGIEYVHLGVAGNPHRKEKHDIDLCLLLYADHLSQHPGILDRVAREISDGLTAVLCYERNHHECHRSILLEALVSRGHEADVIAVE